MTFIKKEEEEEEEKKKETERKNIYILKSDSRN